MKSHRKERRVRSWRFVAALSVAFAPSLARASFLSGDALDAFANGLSWFILCVVPLAAIGLFFYVHVLPELIAERNHHPHKHSIKVLCILSLFFGGMLWPFAWLWAYTKPIGYRAIYGTEKHEDYYHEMGEKVRAGTLTAEELAQLRHELEAMAAKGALPPALHRILDDLRAPAARLPDAAPPREKAAEAH
jgi:CBS domain containing-hemolysin-like protein